MVRGMGILMIDPKCTACGHVENNHISSRTCAYEYCDCKGYKSPFSSECAPEQDIAPFYASYYAFLAVLFGGTLLGAIAFGIGYGIAELVNWVGVLTR